MIRRIALALVALAVVAAGVVVLYRRSAGPTQVDLTLVEADARTTLVVDEGTAIADVLAAVGMEPDDGRLLSLGGTVLEPRHDPSSILLDGTPVEPSTTISETARTVEVVDGTDEVEGSRTVEVDVPMPDVPDVIRHVEERGRVGRERQVVGEISGEVASRETLVAARAPARTDRKVVALTFDDGPTDAWTPYVLEILRSRGVKATFCMVGTAVEKRPELARRVVAEGHQVCNHTQGHDEGLAEAGQDRVDDELGTGRATMIEHGLPAPEMYRPPGGNLSDRVIETARAQGERVVMWKVDTQDWQRTATVDTVMANLRAQVEQGAVILLHDGGGSNRLTTLAVLPGLIDELRAQGYGFTFPLIDPS